MFLFTYLDTAYPIDDDPSGMSVSTERLIYDQPPLRPSLEETPDSQQHTPSQSSVPQAASDDQEYFLQEKQEVMSTPVVHPGTEKASLAPEIDAKESVEHVDPLKKAITLEAERMAEHAGPKVGRGESRRLCG